MFGNALRFCALLGIVLFAVTACGGSGLSGSAPPAVEPPSNSAANATDFAHGPFMFVSNGNEILVFPLSAQGDASPVKTYTNMGGPLAFSPSGELLTGIEVAANPVSYGEFLVNTDGSLTTTRTISFDCAQNGAGIAADAHGTVYIASMPDAPYFGVDVIPPGVSDCGSNEQIIAGDRTGLGSPTAVDVGHDGTLYVLNSAVDYGVISVTTYAPGASGNVAPLHQLLLGPVDSFFPAAMALDGAGDVYVTGEVQHPDYSTEGAVWEFAPITGNSPARLRDIEGPNTRLGSPTGIAVGSDGTIYVTDDATLDVKAFSAGANGDAAPVRRIAGPKAGFSPNVGPSGIALAPEYASCSASP